MGPISGGIKVDAMYGNFEKCLLNSALFGLAIYSFPHNHGNGTWLYLKGTDPIGDTPIFNP